MKSLSSVGLGLSIVFGCLLLALVGELYYLLWWKRRFTNKELGEEYSNPARDFFYKCFQKHSSIRNSTQELCSSVGITDTIVQTDHQELEEDQLEINSTSKDLLLKSFGDQYDPMEAEIMRLHGLSGPPRFLFTIVEETKEDLESEDGRTRGDHSEKGSKGRSLSDLLLTLETPYLTPLASPSFFTPPLTPMDCKYDQHGVNYLFEVSKDAEFNRMKSSPPPKFKFLQDAEEKLYKKFLIEEDGKKAQILDGSKFDQHCHRNAACSRSSKGEEDGNLITIVVDKNKEKEIINRKHQHQMPQYHSSTSQVIPLDSSPFQHSNQQPREVPFSIRS